MPPRGCLIGVTIELEGQPSTDSVGKINIIPTSGCKFMPTSGLQNLYLRLICKFIPMSGLQVYTYFCYTVLYLLLL